jgi:hypothetical protein
LFYLIVSNDVLRCKQFSHLHSLRKCRTWPKPSLCSRLPMDFTLHR